MLFVDFNSAFKTVSEMKLKWALCNWELQSTIRYWTSLQTLEPSRAVCSATSWFLLYTYDCNPRHQENSIVKLRVHIKRKWAILQSGAQKILNVDAMKEVIIDFRKRRQRHTALSLLDTRFFWYNIKRNPSRSSHISISGRKKNQLKPKLSSPIAILKHN